MECNIEGCNRPSFCRGWCSMHYSRWQRHGETGPAESTYDPDRICSIEGCDRKTAGRGWCGQHYARWRKTGDPVYVAPTLLERIMTKVSFAESGCWEWTGAKINGYGRVNVNRRSAVAHRVLYELTVGTVPAEMDLDHLCVNPGCVNPAHLEPVSHAENMRRGPTNVAARNAAKTHCPQGHPYDEVNTRYRSNGNRICRTCDNARSRAHYQRRRTLRG